MGYDITLNRNGSKSKIKTIKFAELPRGAQFKLGDPERVVTEDDLELYVTFNYSWYYYQTINKDEGIKCINGKKAKEVLPLLESALPKIDRMIIKEKKSKKVLSETWGAGSDYDDSSTDYWDVSAKNAKAALEQLVALGKIAPNFTFQVFD